MRNSFRARRNGMSSPTAVAFSRQNWRGRGAKAPVIIVKLCPVVVWRWLAWGAGANASSPFEDGNCGCLTW